MGIFAVANVAFAPTVSPTRYFPAQSLLAYLRRKVVTANANDDTASQATLYVHFAMIESALRASEAGEWPGGTNLSTMTTTARVAATVRGRASHVTTHDVNSRAAGGTETAASCNKCCAPRRPTFGRKKSLWLAVVGAMGCSHRSPALIHMFTAASTSLVNTHAPHLSTRRQSSSATQSPVSYTETSDLSRRDEPRPSKMTQTKPLPRHV